MLVKFACETGLISPAVVHSPRPEGLGASVNHLAIILQTFFRRSAEGANDEQQKRALGWALLGRCSGPLLPGRRAARPGPGIGSDAAHGMEQLDPLRL